MDFSKAQGDLPQVGCMEKRIKIKIECQATESIMVFFARWDSPLGETIHYFRSKWSVNIGSGGLVHTYHGKRILPADTPRSLGMCLSDNTISEYGLQMGG